MGLDVYSRAFIALRLPMTAVKELVKERTFDHNYPEDWKVDPKTGEPLWRELLETRAIFKDNRFGKYKIEYSMQNHVPSSTCDGYAYIILVGVNTGSHRNGLLSEFGKRADLPTEAQVQEFREACVKANIWNEANFGLWADAHLSY